jgi:4-alpha-glucanotransferase
MFERDAAGGFKPARRYPRLALATANTHDMASLAGFCQGRDLELRAQVGLASPSVSAAEAQESRDAEVSALVRRLAQAKLLPRAKVPVNPAELRGAVHAFLVGTPAALVGLALDDLTGEVEPVNIPGVEPDRYPCWTRKMRASLEQIPASADVHAALRGVSRPRTASN